MNTKHLGKMYIGLFLCILLSLLRQYMDKALTSTEYCNPLPSSTPTLVANISNTLVQNLETMCLGNTEAWRNPTNAEWLAEHVVKPTTSWKYQNNHWVYTYVPEYVSLLYAGYTQEYAESFTYPGFGTFTVSLYKGGTKTVNATDQTRWLKFIKLELSCP